MWSVTVCIQWSHNVRKRTRLPSEDSGLPAYSHSPIKIFIGYILDCKGCKTDSCRQSDQTAGGFKSSLSAHDKSYVSQAAVHLCPVAKLNVKNCFPSSKRTYVGVSFTHSYG